MLTIWRFSDGKRGHDNQSLGLVDAFCRLTTCQVETVNVPSGWLKILYWLFRHSGSHASLPKPDFIIGAGHATHWPMLLARGLHGGRIAVLMKPSLPLSWFDWVIAPAHDGLPEGKSVMVTQGPLNRIQKSSSHDIKEGLMLIGGPSSEYGWSESTLLKQIHLISLHHGEINWQLTTSRRTPEGFLKNLENLDISNVTAVPHDEVDSDWLPVHLAQASQVWVTPDSASMVYEALTAGAAVGCFELPYARPGRVARGLERLIREKRVTTFSDWERHGKLVPCTQELNEAERCARQLLPWLNRTS